NAERAYEGGGEVAWIGDSARKQMIDRGMDDRDSDDYGRPQDVDLPVLGARQVVRGESEVEVGEEAGAADSGREQAGASAVPPGLGSGLRAGRHHPAGTVPLPPPARSPKPAPEADNACLATG